MSLLFFPPLYSSHPTVEVVREKGFHLDVEDYLAGVLIMASELVSQLIVCNSSNFIRVIMCSFCSHFRCVFIKLKDHFGGVVEQYL